MAKATVCKTVIHRFKSGRRLKCAGVAELVDARDLKSLGLLARAGSIPALGTRIWRQKRRFFYFLSGRLAQLVRVLA